MRSLFLSAILLLLYGTASALEVQYDVPQPEITSSGAVNASLMFVIGEPGSPAVPVYPVKVLLPPGTQADRVSIRYGERIELGSYLLPPVQQEWAISRSMEAVPTQRDPDLWSQPGELPQREQDAFSTSYLAGYSILLTHACPVRYDPVTQQLSYYSDFVVLVETTAGDCDFSPQVTARQRVVNLIDNPEAIYSYEQRDTRPMSYDYLVVAPEELMDSFQQLVDWRNGLGMASHLVTIEEILAAWDGVDDAERLRNFLIAEYADHSFSYLLLGGDVELVPYRELYVYTWSYTDDLPSDFYFAGLDGNWDENQNGVWGEVDEEDWFGELAVGRAGVSTIAEASAFVNKQLSYQQSPVVADLTSCLLVGESVDEHPTFGGDFKDLIQYGSDEYGIETTGLPDNFAVTELYDRNAEWELQELLDQLNQGTNMLNHMGHCGINSMMRISSSDVNTDNFTADGFDHNFHIGYSQGCHAGAFENNDCVVEKVTNLSTGFVAFIGNSRYGLYQPGTTNGASQHFDREFFDALFGEGISTLGKALLDSRDDLVTWAGNTPRMRWVFYELNLFGDPALRPWSREPLELNVTYDDVVGVGTTGLPVQVNGDDIPAEGLLAAVVFEGETIGRALTDGSGTALIEFDPALEFEGDYDLVISGWNCLPTYLPLTVTGAAGPFLVVAALELDDSQGNGNGLPEAGEEFLLTVSLLNVGVEEATGVNALLISSSGYLEVTEGLTTLPDILPGHQETADVPFELLTASHITDMQNVLCNLTIWCDGGVWGEDVPLVLHVPILEPTGADILDGDNERLDPGETAPLEITLLNSGSGWATGFEALLESPDPQVIVDLAVDTLQQLLPDEETELTFQLTAGAEVEPGDLVNLTLTLTPPFGPVVAMEVPIIIGLKRESFESGDFSDYEWEHFGDAYWYIVEEDPYEGSFCARSGPITHSQTTTLELEQYVLMEGTIDFYCRVSSQQYQDLLRFYIDDVEQMQTSGETDWVEGTFFVTAGWHTYTWTYRKSVTISHGEDCVWLDSITFPPSGVSLPPDITLDPDSISTYADYAENADTQFMIGNEGEIPLEFTLAFETEQLREFSDDMENGEGDWTHSGSGDPWHLSTRRSQSPAHAWYMGEEGTWHYQDGQYCNLISPAFMAPNDSELRFWHWGEMETSDNLARDGGFVSISVDGGVWQLIEPVGGYPCQIAPAVGSPFPAGTGCYSGSYDWEEAVFDLSPWAGDNVQVSFRFGSNPALNYEGWFIDNMTLTSDSPDWISYQPSSGVVNSDQVMPIFMHFRGGELADTLLTGNMLLTSNDPYTPSITIPISFQVGPYDHWPLVEVTPTELTYNVDFGQDTTTQLTIANSGIDPLNFTLSFGDGSQRNFSDDMENGENEWTHDGLNDPWHLTTHDSHSPDHAWYVGLEDLWEYQNSQYARLITPSFSVTNDTRLRFWHRGELEADTTAATDAGLLEVAVNGGGWLPLTPVDGYPGVVAAGTGSPFPVGTGCYTGSWEWEEALFDLNSWAGDTLQIGFLFGSNEAVVLEGWYIDDLQVEGSAPDWISYQPGSGSVAGDDEMSIAFQFLSAGYEDTTVTGSLLVVSNDPFTPEVNVPISFTIGPDEGVDEIEPLTFRLEQNYPNPFNPVTRISFCLPHTSPVLLEVFDLRGRLIRKLVDSVQPAGVQVITFDAAELASGIYFYRISAGDFNAVKKMMLIR
jgi:hypothetical protein